VRTTLAGLLDDLGIVPRSLTMGSHGATIAAARTGLGATLVSREAVRDLLAAGALVELPLAGTPLARPWHLVTHPDATASAELLVHDVRAGLVGGWLPGSLDAGAG
jgi:DNA-binding transcriptional LysR family regulator